MYHVFHTLVFIRDCNGLCFYDNVGVFVGFIIWDCISVCGNNNGRGMMKIQVTKKKDWYYRILGDNGAVLATSETYSSKRNAIRAAEKLSQRLNTSFIEVEIKD